MLGLVTFLTAAPVLFLGLYGGSVADRYARRPLVALSVGAALVQASALAALTLGGWVRPWHLLALSTVMGLTYSFEVPARQSLLADLAGRDVPNAVALNSTVVTLMRIAGPSLAGVIIGAFGEGFVFLLNAVSFLAVLAALARIRVESPPPRQVGSTRAEVLEALRYTAGQPLMLALLLVLLTTSLFGVSYGALMPVVASRLLGGGPELLGRLLACAGAGSLVGAVTVLLWGQGSRAARLVGAGASCMGLGVLGLALSRAAPLSAAALALLGFGQMVQSTGTLSLLQGLAPQALRGRLVGVFTTIFVGLPPLGALAAGLLAAEWSVPGTLGTFGALVLAASVAFHLALPRLRLRG